MQLAMAKLIMKLFKAGNRKGLRMLANQKPNTGSVESMIKKSIIGPDISLNQDIENTLIAPEGERVF